MNLDGQTAIVTGAGSAEGIGFAIARKLHAAGARVAITSTTERIQERARELDATGKRVIAFVADLTREAAAQKLVAAVLQRTGRIDILVNNAGMTQTGQPIESNSLQNSSYKDWLLQIEITLHTAVFITPA